MTPWKIAVLAIIIVLSGIAGCSACTTVDAGEIGLKNSYGQISERVAEPGLHIVNPITTKMETMTVSALRWDATTPVYTQDLQTAQIAFAMTYSLNREAAVSIRRHIGREWAARLIPPIAQSSIKNVFAQYTAMNAVAKRPEVQQKITEIVRTRLAKRGINVQAFEITNIDYSDAFEQAVEQAQVATQRAVAARNQTAVVREQGEQKKIAAAAEAESMRVRSQALEANPKLVEWEAVQKWDGHLPQNMYGSAPMPFIDAGRN